MTPSNSKNNMGPLAQAGISAIGGIGQILTQGIQNRHERQLNERSIQAQREAAQLEYDQNLLQWQRENEYNAPTQQMSRLREAGLNPAMIYGSGGAKTVSATSPKYQAVRPTYDYAPPANPLVMLDAYNDFRIKNAQVDLLRSQAETKRAEANNADKYFYERTRRMLALAGQEWFKYGWQKDWDHERKQVSAYTQFDHQLQALDLTNQIKSEQIANLNKDGQLRDLDIENYFFNRMGSGVLGMIGKGASKLLPWMKAQKGIKLTPYTPRYNSPSNWNSLDPTSKF